MMEFSGSRLKVDTDKRSVRTEQNAWNVAKQINFVPTELFHTRRVLRTDSPGKTNLIRSHTPLVFCAPLVKEEQPLPGRVGESRPGPLDVQVLDEGPEADEHAEGHDEPPKPRVVVGRHLGGALHDQGPLCQGEAEAREGTISGKQDCNEADEHAKGP